jgi:hypothetical protein
MMWHASVVGTQDRKRDGRRVCELMLQPLWLVYR